jgi:hypothetical protein
VRESRCSPDGGATDEDEELLRMDVNVRKRRYIDDTHWDETW